MPLDATSNQRFMKYVYGGSDGSVRHGGLYKLSHLEWSQLSVESDANGPMKRSGCQIVCINKSKIGVIGGYGLPHDPSQPGSSFIQCCDDTTGNGWTNEVCVFDTEERKC